MKYKSILCLNGDLPEKAFFKNFPHLPIVAADGAANKLNKMGINFLVAIGDMDSINPDLQVQKIYHADQDLCDFEKSLNYLESKNLLPSIILGMNGGEFDHVLNNTSVFMMNEHENIFYAPPLYGAKLNKHLNNIHLPVNTKVSIVGMPNAVITTHGLKWNLDKHQLKFPGFNSCLNISTSSNLQVQLLDGDAIFMAHSFFEKL